MPPPSAVEIETFVINTSSRRVRGPEQRSGIDPSFLSVTAWDSYSMVETTACSLDIMGACGLVPGAPRVFTK